MLRYSGDQQVWGLPDDSGRFGTPRSADPVARPAELGPEQLALLAAVIDLTGRTP